jgi:UDP-N-acetylmuramyl pentapeptide phosphotransferase/UDP-N-acetylglucosamine-1-phosphate transferase
VIALMLSPGVLRDLWPALAGVLALSVLGLVDDVRGLAARVRFLLQFLVCVGFVSIQPLPHHLNIVSIDLNLAWLRYPLHALWLMWMLNLFNFMDGIDGFAGSQLAFTALFFWLGAAGSLSLLGVILLGAALGFLVWNWPQAKVFMGDVGSTSLGFLLGAMALQASPEVPLVASTLVLLPFVFDATFTLLRRLREKRRVWEAHRSHIYQLPQSWGVSNTHVLGVELVFLTFQLALGLLYLRLDHNGLRWLIVGFSLTVASLIFGCVLRYARKNGQGVRW